MEIKKIVVKKNEITRDEFYSIYLIQAFLGKKIDIEKVTELPVEYLLDKTIICIGIGGFYQSELLNFDIESHKNFKYIVEYLGLTDINKDLTSLIRFSDLDKEKLVEKYRYKFIFSMKLEDILIDKFNQSDKFNDYIFEIMSDFFSEMVGLLTFELNRFKLFDKNLKYLFNYKVAYLDLFLPDVDKTDNDFTLVKYLKKKKLNKNILFTVTRKKDKFTGKDSYFIYRTRSGEKNGLSLIDLNEKIYNFIHINGFIAVIDIENIDLALKDLEALLKKSTI